MKTVAVITSEKSWFTPYVRELKKKIKKLDLQCDIYSNHEETRICYDVVFLLSYFRMVPDEFLKKNKHNIIVHASDLPKGKGWSPLSWQVLEGEIRIHLCCLKEHRGWMTEIFI
jgi:methionyl-tRNA formyltransferase